MTTGRRAARNAGRICWSKSRMPVLESTEENMAAPRRKIDAPVTEPTSDDIARRAYELYLSFDGFHAHTATAGKPAIVVLTAARVLRVSLVD